MENNVGDKTSSLPHTILLKKTIQLCVFINLNTGISCLRLNGIIKPPIDPQNLTGYTEEVPS